MRTGMRIFLKKQETDQNPSLEATSVQSILSDNTNCNNRSNNVNGSYNHNIRGNNAGHYSGNNCGNGNNY